jgi:Na+/H+ antiporter NhaD/arsenite permease-like protein
MSGIRFDRKTVETHQPTAVVPHLWMVTPFMLLIFCAALGPLWLPAWWSRHYAKVSLGLGSFTVLLYLIGLRAVERVLSTSMEYVSFITLIASLYVVSGGIHMNVKGETKPSENVLFLLMGAVIANLLGTTGASMLLIRPWIRMNKYRITAYHIVFFIFIISNVGGCLTPIGDPPLFLGYLQGVPFWWIARHCWPIWLVALAILLAIFYVLDSINFRKAPRQVRVQLTGNAESWQFRGSANVFFLIVILGAVFLNKPRFLRELVMAGAALGSYLTTSKAVHQANDFDFHPIREVGILFAGIFATMMPALDWLGHNAALLGTPSPTFFFWASGSLSSVLDNAPTYLSFFSVLLGSIDQGLLRELGSLWQAGGVDMASLSGPYASQLQLIFPVMHSDISMRAGESLDQAARMSCILGLPEQGRMLVALSVGAVFFGANTYIGNGPNFMVKAIADQQKVNTPTFVGYIFKYSLPVMLPMLLMVWWLFFR